MVTCFKVDVEGVSGRLASEELGVVTSESHVPVDSAELLTSFCGVSVFSFSLDNSSGPGLAPSLIRKLSISLLACFAGGLDATEVGALTVSLLAEEETGDMGGDSKASRNR